MKKVLIIAYDFPPYVSVGGLRPYSWYKYMKEFGVEPIVVTRQWSNKHGNALDYISASESKETLIEQTEYGTIIRAPYFPSISNRILLKYGEQKFTFFRRALTAWDEFRQFITISGPKKHLFHAANDYLKHNKVDAIIATGDPFITFYFAKKLGAKYNVPWIADYRDPWSQNLKIPNNFKLFIKIVEKNVVSTATSITTVSQFLKKKITQNLKHKIFHILPNGYDQSLTEIVENLPQKSDKLTIAFAGTIYQWHPWKSFLSVCSHLIEHHNIHVHLQFYGLNNPIEFNNYILTLPIKTQNSISITPKLQNKELLQQLAQCNLMLLFNDYSILGTKIYDYLGIKRKIILCYKNDTQALQLKNKYYNIEEVEGVSKTLQEDLIKETNAGIVVENEEHLKQVLVEISDELKQNGYIESQSTGVEAYSRKIQAKHLADIIKSL